MFDLMVLDIKKEWDYVYEADWLSKSIIDVSY